MVVQAWPVPTEHQAPLVKWDQLGPTDQMENQVQKVRKVKMLKNLSERKVEKVQQVKLVMLVTKVPTVKMAVKAKQAQEAALEDQVSQASSDPMGQSEVQEQKDHQDQMPNIVHVQAVQEVVVAAVAVVVVAVVLVVLLKVALLVEQEEQALEVLVCQLKPHKYRPKLHRTQVRAHQVVAPQEVLVALLVDQLALVVLADNTNDEKSKPKCNKQNAFVTTIPVNLESESVFQKFLNLYRQGAMQKLFMMF